jgi:hypothetical protein
MQMEIKITLEFEAAQTTGNKISDTVIFFPLVISALLRQLVWRQVAGCFIHHSWTVFVLACRAFWAPDLAKLTRRPPGYFLL